MNQELGRSLVLTAALGVIGCGRSTPPEYAEFSGHRVQRASVQAHGAPDGAVRTAERADFAPFSVRLLVHEQSGEATLLRRR